MLFLVLVLWGIHYLHLHYSILLFIIKEIDIQLEKAKRHSRLAFFSGWKYQNTYSTPACEVLYLW